jgi:hypothetical protein
MSAVFEIGTSLREARSRRQIGLPQAEQATKIRAKYLRAIENEEWSLLPGPTFIKSFLREYADYLGLDARMLVEEYKLRYERPSEYELAPISPNLGRERRGGRGASYRPPRTAPPWLIVGGAVVLLVVVLGLVGSIFGSGGGGGNHGSTSPDHTASGTRSHRATTIRSPRASAPALASVRIVPTGTVYVCLVDGSGRVLIHGAQFNAGETVPVYRARTLRMTLGNNAVQLRVNGRPLTVSASSQAIAYEITPTGARALPAAQAPTCQ